MRPCRSSEPRRSLNSTRGGEQQKKVRWADIGPLIHHHHESAAGLTHSHATDKKKALEAEQQRLKRPAPGGEQSGRPSKAARGAGLKPTGPAAAAVVPDEYLPPNKILFVQNLPDDSDAVTLTNLFGRFEGFREVRMVPGRRGIAFVEYENEAGAIAARENLAGTQLGGKNIKVTYQRQ